MNARFDRMEAQFDERFEKIDERFEKIDERFEKIDERFERVDQRFEGSSKGSTEIRKRRRAIQSTQEMIIGVTRRSARLSMIARRCGGPSVAAQTGLILTQL